MVEPIHVIITTYRRTDLAIKTILGIKENFHWPNLLWTITDDGSEEEDIQLLINTISPQPVFNVFRNHHKGTGHNMNVALQDVWRAGGNLTLMMEDDWVIEKPMDVDPYVRVLLDHPEYGMIRFGYISPGISGVLIKVEGRLYWRLEKNQDQYRYVGHPSLRNKAFYNAYGKYAEGLTPGATELHMCGIVNSIDGPKILIPADGGWYGFFAHIGASSLADIQPGS